MVEACFLFRDEAVVYLTVCLLTMLALPLLHAALGRPAVAVGGHHTTAARRDRQQWAMCSLGHTRCQSQDWQFQRRA